MNEVRKTHEESPATRTYVAPHARVVHFQSEGVLCVSGLTQQFVEEDFSNGRFWD